LVSDIEMKKLLPRLIGLYLNLLAWIAPRLAARKGFDLFCTPLPAQVTAYHRKFFDTAERGSFEHEGIRIQTYRWGSGKKKMLFLHGWQSHSFRWKNYLDFLSKEEYMLYALDAPAHGLSGSSRINLPLYGRVVAHAIATFGPWHAVISHSFGSFALLYAASQDPRFPVDRLVVTGTPGEAEDFIRFYQDMLALSTRTRMLVARYFEKTLGHPASFFSAARFAQEISIPGLIIHDEKDEEAPYRYAIAIHKAWKNSTLITTSGLGHNLKSANVIRHVVDFVTEREPARDS
jgi:pimeloyl-ACP methyl ester carboxylesterase